MTMDEHKDCDRQLNKAEDRIIMLNKVIGDLKGRIAELEAKLKTWHSPENLNTACRIRDERVKELETKLLYIHKKDK